MFSSSLQPDRRRNQTPLARGDNGRRRFSRLEMLEARQVLAVVTVTTVADDLTPNDGTVSLREAITAINAGNDLGDPNIIAQNPGTFGTSDAIHFNIAGSGVLAHGSSDESVIALIVASDEYFLKTSA